MGSPSQAQPSDAELLARIEAGDPEALEALIARYQRQVLRFSMKMCRHREDAEDVLQDTLLAAARGIRQFRGAASLSTWMYTIARSYCIKKHRKSKFAPAHERSLEQDVAAEARALEDPGPSPEDQTAANETEAALQAGIAALDDKYREILVLRDVEGLSAAEVAEVTGLSVAAVKSRLHRARNTLRAHLVPLLEADRPAETGPECPNIAEVFSQHLEGEISAEVCARMEAHVAGCERCKQTCDGLRSVLKTCQACPAPEVPEAVQRAVRAAVRRTGA